MKAIESINNIKNTLDICIGLVERSGIENVNPLTLANGDIRRTVLLVDAQTRSAFGRMEFDQTIDGDSSPRFRRENHLEMEIITPDGTVIKLEKTLVPFMDRIIRPNLHILLGSQRTDVSAGDLKNSIMRSSAPIDYERPNFEAGVFTDTSTLRFVSESMQVKDISSLDPHRVGLDIVERMTKLVSAVENSL